MVNLLVSATGPLSGPNKVALSPLAELSRLLAQNGFPQRKSSEMATKAPSLEADLATSSGDGASEAERESLPEESAVPAFAYIFAKEAAIVPANSKLMLFVPQSAACPQPVRVVERSACKAKWFEIESWHENTHRWIDRDVAPKKKEAFEKARAMSWLVAEEPTEAG